MLTLDPAKLLIVGVVALFVLGPDKLPATARKAAGLMRDLRRFRASVHEQVTAAVGSEPLLRELTDAKGHLLDARSKLSSRAALYRSIGLSDEEMGLGPAAAPVAAVAPSTGSVATPQSVAPVMVAATDDITCN
jgi:Sec-independent protein translocase protein TatA